MHRRAQDVIEPLVFSLANPRGWGCLGGEIPKEGGIREVADHQRGYLVPHERTGGRRHNSKETVLVKR